MAGQRKASSRTAPDDRCREDATPGGRMEIALDGGRRITVCADVDGEALRRVLGVLEGR
jgi:hypothetical protein